MTTDRTMKMTYRGEWFMFRIEEVDGYLYRATAYRETDVLAVSDRYESPGEAVASLIADVIGAVDFVHAEIAFERARDGVALS